MDMPKPKPVEAAPSLTTLTPHYQETTLFTKKEILSEVEKGSGKDQASMFSYLKTVHPDEWDNFVERLGIRKEVDAAGGDIPESVWSNPEQATEVQLWASLRGQTLARTICGVMQFEKALLMFAKQESQYNQTVPSAACSNLSGGDSGSGDIGAFDADATTSPRPLWKADPLWMRRAHLKYAYVISCQVYGKWDDKNELKIGVDTLMKRFPHLRIAYVQEENGKFFSYLIRWDEERNRIVKCYRIEQACSKGGNANWGPAWLVGEGKPENQNHAIVFTRGEYLQTLDMNQDGYFEEALKMRNLLQEFLEEGNEDVRIIGFPEHQFSDALSAVAEFAALTEFTFATLIQRTLGSPFDVRMHYGHPDVFDRIFHVTRGGISKPTKTLCVSEDIFGAFNSVLKGGRVIHREYIKQGKGKDLGFDACALFEQKISSGNAEQALSRDFSRLCEQMGITRLLSFFHSSNGFYWSNLFVIWGTSYFLYSQILISVVIPDEHDGALMTVTESVAFAFQLGLLLTIPLVAELILQKGPMAAFMTMIRVLYTMGPLFFMFHIRTKAYYYERTLVLGGAGYKATGRSFVLNHNQFLTLFQQFHYSHLNYGMTLTLNLLVYRCFIVDPDAYFLVTWATWLFAIDMLWAPFIFNCNALDRAEVAEDWKVWESFLWREDIAGDRDLKDAAKDSWRAHFELENEVFKKIDMSTRVVLIMRDVIWVILPLAILLEKNASSTESIKGYFWRSTGVAMGEAMLVLVLLFTLLGLVLMLLHCCFPKCMRRWRRQCSRCAPQLGHCCCKCVPKFGRKKRLTTMLIGCAFSWLILSLLLNYGNPMEVVAVYVTSIGYIVSFTTNALFYMGFRFSLIYDIYWLHDAVLGYGIQIPIYILSVISAFSDAHMFLLYNSKFVEVLSNMRFRVRVRQAR